MPGACRTRRGGSRPPRPADPRARRGPPRRRPAIRPKPWARSGGLVAVEVRRLQPSPPRRREHDHERLPDHLVLRHEPHTRRRLETRVARVRPDCPPARTACHRAPSRAGRPGIDSGFRYGSSTLSPLTKSCPVVDLDDVAGKPDHPLDEVLVLGLRDADPLPQPVQRRADRPAVDTGGGMRVGEHDHVATMDVADADADPAHEDPVALLQRRGPSRSTGCRRPAPGRS